MSSELVKEMIQRFLTLPASNLGVSINRSRSWL